MVATPSDQRRPRSGVVIGLVPLPPPPSSCGVSAVRCAGRNLLLSVFGNRELVHWHRDGEPFCGSRLAFCPGAFRGPKLMRRGLGVGPFPCPEGLVLQEAAAAPGPPGNPVSSPLSWRGLGSLESGREPPAPCSPGRGLCLASAY